MLDNRMPNLFVAGAPKCGTTAFVAGLGQHPDIFVGKKEPRYFDASVYFDDPADYPHKNLESYLQLYISEEARNAAYRTDASVFNMYRSDGIKEILRLSPNAKFIVILRDPVEAARSMHSQRLKYTSAAMREVSESFLDCWALMEKRRQGLAFPKGCKNKNLFRYDFLYDYKPHIEILERLVPAHQLIFVDYEIFKQNPERLYRKIFEFLGLRHASIKSKTVNASFALSLTFKNKMIQALREILIKLPFRPKKLMGVVKSFFEMVEDKKQILREKDDHRITDVEAYFEESKQAMLEVVWPLRSGLRDEKNVDS